MNQTGGRATLIFKQKLALRSGLLRDGVIWKIPKNEKYPDGVRYRLALIDIISGKLLVLFDNHFPKGHHRHFSDGTETSYIFDSLETLIEDYLKAVQQEEGSRENKKN